MPDSLGRITIPTPTASGQTFPLISDFPVEMSRSWDVITHRFGGDALLASQRFSTLSSARRFLFHKPGSLSFTERANLLDFYDTVQGSFQSFRLWVPNADRSGDPIDFGPIAGPPNLDPLGRLGTAYTVTFENSPLSITHLANRCQTGITFVEEVTDLPPYTVNATYTLSQLPGSSLATALLDQVQQLVPLIHILPRSYVAGSADDNIYLSDRRCTVNGQLYLPRVIGLGDQGSDVIFTQDISGQADNVRFTFGNADRAFSLLTRDTGLKFADITFSLYHIGTGSRLDLWRGIIVSYTRDGSPLFSVQCSDGLYPITQQYPRRTISHQCWKQFNDGNHCPWSSVSPGVGDSTKCDYFFNSPNGCLSHGMSPYFGGHPYFPQSVTIKDNGTGTVGKLGRQTVTSTSIANDSIWNKALPEIWCNSHGDPVKSFIANTIVAAVRDESDFESVLGIVGVGPIGQFAVDDPRPGGVVTSIKNGIPVPPGEGGKIATTVDGLPILVAPIADGFPPQGFKVDIAHPSQTGDPTKDNDLGLRQFHGDDPIPTAIDFWTQLSTHSIGAFSLGQGTPQNWDVPDSVYSQIDTGKANTILPLAAGTALVEVRYVKSPSKGLAPTTAESHTLSVPIAQGLTGVTFDSSNSRTSVPGLTNPFWVAVNTYLRALSLDGASESSQLASFVRESVYKGDGTGPAEISDILVPPLVGDPLSLETQFQFQGTIAEFKPFRDWLTSILTCCLGFFSFEYGRLKLGIRSHAVPTSAFTVANMLVDSQTAQSSLSLTPAPETFEYMKLSFANVDLQYQNDFAEYLDKDHSTYFGRNGAPLTTDLRSPGVSTMSQGLRVTGTRVREEIGGILRPDQPNPYIEWDNNLIASWRTTVLALEVSVGQVISITHPDLATYPGPAPGGSGWSNTTNHTWAFRITRLSLHRDWSISITAKSVTDSMYDLDVGPKPGAVAPPPPPILFHPQPLQQWGPYQVQTLSTDALFPNEFSFDVSEGYAASSDGTPIASVIGTGKEPVTKFVVGTGAPSLTLGNVTLSDTGGSFPGGVTLRVQVCAMTTDGQLSPPSKIITVKIPVGTDTNKFTLLGVVWPSDPSFVKYAVFIGLKNDLIEAFTLGSGLGSDIPIEVLGPVEPLYSWSVPDPFVTKLKLGVKQNKKPGVAIAQVDSAGVGSAYEIICTTLIDPARTDDWIGRKISVIGRPGSLVPYLSFDIVAFDPATGTLTTAYGPSLDQPVFVVGRDDLSVLAGDTIVIRSKGYDNSADPMTILDAGYANTTNNHDGLADIYTGSAVRVIAGFNRGTGRANIVGNVSDTLLLDRPLLLDQTSIWIIEGAEYDYVGETDISNSRYNTSISQSVPVANFFGSLQDLIVSAAGGVGVVWNFYQWNYFYSRVSGDDAPPDPGTAGISDPSDPITFSAYWAAAQPFLSASKTATNSTLLVVPFTEDDNGNQSDDSDATLREIFMYGRAFGTVTLGGGDKGVLAPSNDTTGIVFAEFEDNGSGLISTTSGPASDGIDVAGPIRLEYDTPVAYILGRCKTAPGADFKVDIMYSTDNLSTWHNLLTIAASGHFTIPSGSTSWVKNARTSIAVLPAGTDLRLNVISGSAQDFKFQLVAPQYIRTVLNVT